jgi:uncharacterized membrane protein YbjE (DUF340 family)
LSRDKVPLIKIAAAATIVAAVLLAVGAGGYALFNVAQAQWGATTAAVVVAIVALILAGAVALTWWLIDKRRRETKAAAPGLSDYLIDIAIERPVTTALAAAAMGWICLRYPRLVATAVELLLVGRRNPER